MARFAWRSSLAAVIHLSGQELVPRAERFRQLMTARMAGTALVVWGMFTAHALDRYVSLEGSHVPPFTSWADAATNIQDAVDAAVAGDTVWVTNGLYNTGGKVVGGLGANRVAVDKALTLRGVNGPAVTIIQGAYHPVTTNGSWSVRGVYLGSGATLQGFSVVGGSTSTPTDTLGGGIWALQNNLIVDCAINSNAAAGPGGGISGSPTVTISNCVISANFAKGFGGGVARGFLSDCRVEGNRASSGGGTHDANVLNSLVYGNTATTGGGMMGGRATNSLILLNSASQNGGGTYNTSMRNCTVTMNTASNQSGGIYGGYGASLENCIIYGNEAPSGSNHFNASLSYSCTAPLPAGTGNISADPELYDGVHIRSNSPCRGAANPVGVGTDIDGQPWLNPPSMGCDEWHEGAFGAFVDAASTNPVAPYTTWATAATSIQDAIAASVPLGTVWVTNGVYRSGGKIKYGDLLNRIVLDKAVTVRSVNGPEVTIVEGAWHPGTTNGATAVRCAWVGDGSTLSGFTLQGGATRSVGDTTNLLSGGGVWCSSTTATITNCIIRSNAADVEGGGCYSGTILNSLIESNVSYYGAVSRCKVFDSTLAVNRGGRGGGAAMLSELWRCNIVSNSASRGAGIISSWATDSRIVGNSAGQGGGAYGSWITNCLVADNVSGDTGGGISGTLAQNSLITGNRADRGGGAWGGSLYNCTVVSNSVPSSGIGGVRAAALFNCVVYANSYVNHFESSFQYSCTAPLPGGVGNIGVDPQLLDGVHLATTSPCRGAGATNYATGLDWDGQPWASSPSMGCDEVWQAPLTVSLAASGTRVLQMDSHVGVSYTVDFATNLAPPVKWYPLQTLIATGAVVNIEDTTATNEMRFYRARVP